MKITLRQLKKLGACDGQVNLFKETFGDEVEITEAVVKEHGAKFNSDWLADKVLTPAQLADYAVEHAPLDADYEAKRASIWADYEAKLAPLDADYEAKHAPLDADYEAKRAPIWADYAAKLASIQADYAAKLALVFWEVINN